MCKCEIFIVIYTRRKLIEISKGEKHIAQKCLFDEIYRGRVMLN